MGTHRVRVEETGEAYDCGDGESVLRALARSGRRGIPVGCRGGGCGVCKVAVVDGEFACGPMSRAHVTEGEQAAGHVLACCIYPRTDLRLRVIGRLQRAVTR